MVGEGGERRICSCQALLLGTTWGPFPGKIEAATRGSDKVGSLIVMRVNSKGKFGQNVDISV